MSDIEKTSLEAHVELCGERYERLEEKIDDVVSRIERSYVRFDKMEKSLDKIEEFATNHHTDRFLALETRQSALEDRISNSVKVMSGSMVAVLIGIITGLFTLLP